eukprot:m51a1_g5352 hypothetical protein (655) ;mRNA; r:469408-471856
MPCASIRKWPLRRQVACSVAAMSFLFNAAIFCAAGVYLAGLNTVEKDSSRRDVDRLMASLRGGIDWASSNLNQYAAWDDTAMVFEELLSNESAAENKLLYPWLSANFFATSKDGSELCFRWDFELMALYAPNPRPGDSPLYATYFAHTPTSVCPLTPTAVPQFFANVTEQLAALLPSSRGVIIAPGLGALVLVAQPVTWTDQPSEEPLGSIVWAVRLGRFTSKLAEAVPACVSLFDSGFPHGLSPSPLPDDEYSKWYGHAVLDTSLSSTARSSRGDALSSVCPKIPIRSSARYTTRAWAMVANGVVFRADRPKVVIEAGFRVVLPMVVCVFVATVAMSAGFFAGLEVLVLRRIASFSAFLKQQASQATERVHQQKNDTMRVFRNEQNKNTPGATEVVLAPPSLVDDATINWEDQGNEIATLGGALRANFESLLAGIERGNIALRRQRRCNQTLDAAIRLFNMFNEDSLLVPEVVSLDHTQTPRLGALLESPLALQILMGYCAGEASAENIHFLIDCAFLRLLMAEAKRNDVLQPLVPDTIAQLQSLYFGDNGLDLNVSSHARHAALGAEAGDSRAFEEAEREVFQTVQMDVLSRFAETRACRLVTLLEAIEKRSGEGGRIPRVLDVLLRYSDVRVSSSKCFKTTHISSSYESTS